MKDLILHPFLIPVFPVLFLYAHNQGHLQLRQLPGPLLAALGGAILLFAILRLLWRDSRLAGVAVSLTGLWMFSYHHFRDLVTDLFYAVTGLDLPPWFLVLLYGVLLWALLRAVARRREQVPPVHVIFNAMGIVLTAVALWSIVRFEYRQWRTREAPVPAAVTAPRAVRGLRPDVYYVILDSYGSEEMLCDLYGFDNSPLTAYLRGKGFYVVDGARSNYGQTALSMASSLNLDYIEPLLLRDHGDEESREPLRRLMEGSAVFRVLERQGYAVIVFESWYDAADLRGTGIYQPLGRGPDALSIHLISQTPLSLIHTGMDDVATYRQSILDAFDRLERMPRMRRPFMVLAHIICPHPPFVFDRNGLNPIPRQGFSLTDGPQLGYKTERYRELYLEQLLFVNGRIHRLVEAVLARRERPAIIILQGDHGPGSGLQYGLTDATNLVERFSILNAIYFPGGDYRLLYPGMTPVNTFRGIFRHFFGLPLEPLDDRGYFATWARPYRHFRIF